MVNLLSMRSLISGYQFDDCTIGNCIPMELLRVWQDPIEKYAVQSKRFYLRQAAGGQEARGMFCFVIY